MAAEVIAGAAALLDARERLRGIEAAAEAALDVVVILRFALVRAKLGAQRVGRAHHAVLAGDRRAADGQLVGADDLDRQELGEQRRPLIAEVKTEQRFFMGRAVKLQVFLKRRADGGLQIVRVERARAGEGLGESLFPRGEQRRLLPKDRSPAGGLERIDELVLVHPLLSRELIFRGKKFCGVGAAQLREHGADGKLLFIDGVFQREPREVVERGAPCVVRPKGEETARHLVAQPLADQTDDAVHVEVRRAVGLEGKKLRLKLIVAAGGPDQIDGAALVGAVAVGFHISR